MFKISSMELNLGIYHDPVRRRIRTWEEEKFLSRLWEKDPQLWFPEPSSEITDRLGWLDLPEEMEGELKNLEAYVHRVKGRGIKHVLLLGMGGSSLAPEMFFEIFGPRDSFPNLVVLDSTHPEAIRRVANSIDLSRTLILVSSKSGTTLETLSLFRYFWDAVSRISPHPGQQFTAVTDPGSPLTELAESRGFDAVFLAPRDVGGRFSAFSYFGMVPAALVGVDLFRLLYPAKVSAEKNSHAVREKDSDNLTLGAALAEIGSLRDKITFVVSPSLMSFLDWLEQLIAESLGKEGKGIIPIVREPGMPVDSYGEDRFFIFFYLTGEHNPEQTAFEDAVKRADHPIITIRLVNRYDLGREIFRWEMATAAAGAAMRIHPFNQPDVQLAKNLTQKYIDSNRLGVPGNIGDLVENSPDNPADLRKALDIWRQGAQPDCYVAIQAFLAPLPQIFADLQDLRLGLLREMELATTLGFGPRFLHSTGQLHKGGPNGGLFLQLVDEPGEDLRVPDTDFTFASLLKAQASGDYLALQQRGRKVLRINLGTAVREGIKKVRDVIRQ